MDPLFDLNGLSPTYFVSWDESESGEPHPRQIHGLF